MLPPRSLIWKVTIASANQIMAKTPLKTSLRWSSRALIERRKESSRQKSSGPLRSRRHVSRRPLCEVIGPQADEETYQRSQSLNPSLIPPCKSASASGHLPTNPLNCPIVGTPPPRLSPSPLSAPPSPPPWFSIPPRRYLGQSTCLIFSHTASKSLLSVSQTDSSSVLSGARRSSPGMAELR